MSEKDNIERSPLYTESKNTKLIKQRVEWW